MVTPDILRATSVPTTGLFKLLAYSWSII